MSVVRQLYLKMWMLIHAETEEKKKGGRKGEGFSDCVKREKEGLYHAPYALPSFAIYFYTTTLNNSNLTRYQGSHIYNQPWLECQY